MILFAALFAASAVVSNTAKPIIKGTETTRSMTAAMLQMAPARSEKSAFIYCVVVMIGVALYIHRRPGVGGG